MMTASALLTARRWLVGGAFRGQADLSRVDAVGAGRITIFTTS